MMMITIIIIIMIMIKYYHYYQFERSRHLIDILTITFCIPLVNYLFYYHISSF